MNVFARWIISWIISWIIPLAVLLPGFGIGFGSFAVADEFHNNNLLIGDRASGMGGAYTAISDDATGLFYNPAAIVYASGQNFSASVNTLHNQSKKYEGAIAGRAFERQSSALLANFFGIIKAVGKYKFGFSYAVPDSVNEDQDQIFSDVSADVSRYTINLNNKDNTSNIGPSFAAELSNDLAAGITLYAHRRETQLIVNQFVEKTDLTFEWTNYYYELDELGIRPVIGIAWSPADKLSLGLSLSKTVLFNSRAVGQLTCSDSTTDGCDNKAPTNDPLLVPKLTNSTAKKEYPVRVTVGAAYFASSSLLLSGDLTYHTAVADPFFGDKIATVDVALGTEYYFSKKWALRAGLFTSMANTPAIREGITQIEEHIDLYGGSMSITNFSGDASVTLGGSVSHGAGQSQIVGNKKAQDASALGWMIFLSSAH